MAEISTTANHFGPVGLRLSARALNCLQYEGITTIQQVRALGYDNILRMPNMGVRCAKEVWEAVHSDQAERLIQTTDLAAPSGTSPVSACAWCGADYGALAERLRAAGWTATPPVKEVPHAN